MFQYFWHFKPKLINFCIKILKILPIFTLFYYFSRINNNLLINRSVDHLIRCLSLDRFPALVSRIQFILFMWISDIVVNNIYPLICFHEHSQTHFILSLFTMWTVLYSYTSKLQSTGNLPIFTYYMYFQLIFTFYFQPVFIYYFQPFYILFLTDFYILNFYIHFHLIFTYYFKPIFTYDFQPICFTISFTIRTIDTADYMEPFTRIYSCNAIFSQLTLTKYRQSIY